MHRTRFFVLVLATFHFTACSGDSLAIESSVHTGGGHGGASEPGWGDGESADSDWGASDADTGDWGDGATAPSDSATNSDQPEDTPELPTEEESDLACLEESVSLFLSADDSNSQASPVLVRRLIESGRYVPDYVVRTYEFLNYADFDYAPAASSRLAVYPEARALEDNSDQYSVLLGVRAPAMTRTEARPLNLVLVLDSSGSMAGEPMDLLRSTVTAITGGLLPEDIVSVIRLDASPSKLIDGVAPDTLDLVSLFENLIPNGVTDLHSALGLAYETAVAHRSVERMSRVVIVSDGAANAGLTDIELIGSYAGGAESEGIYLAGVGLGEGFNDSLMDAVTDAGKGAYVLVDSAEEAELMFGERFVSNLEVAALDVQVELVMPPQWAMVKFHGEEISTNPAEVEPQNLAPNDQMTFSQVLEDCEPSDVSTTQIFEVHVSYTDARSGEAQREELSFSMADLIGMPASNLSKSDALVAFAEGLKALYPLRLQPAGDAIEETCHTMLEALQSAPSDRDIDEALALATAYCQTMHHGEQHVNACDCGGGSDFVQALGICEGDITATPQALAVDAEGVSWGGFSSLYESTHVIPREGCGFAALSTGAVGEAETIPGRQGQCGIDPVPEFYGDQPAPNDGANACDINQVSLTLTAPADAQSFSFDFNFFSAEYPDYIGSPFNDTFYAILEAESTNGGRSTNISFDAYGRAIEINNDYFANPFHPCTERGTGFVRGASTCWLRTSWPIMGGEVFTLTFSVHDEGDAIYSSTVLMDNFKFHTYPAVGMTDPLN
ncbi:MAG: VWA domain-containing protein [Myxococcota bacterium]|nr:VWA domain-containing protein [Myxococcota bacterium]